MSSTDTRTVDPAEPHHSPNGGHEMSDFSWTTVLWLLPLSVLVLLVFFAVSIFWFRGAKDEVLNAKQSEFTTPQLNQLRVQEGESLVRYKWVDKDKGTVQIPIARAMELMVKENLNAQGATWKPITDTYLEGAAFGGTESAAAKSALMPEIVAPAAAPAGSHHGAPADSHHGAPAEHTPAEKAH